MPRRVVLLSLLVLSLVLAAGTLAVASGGKGTGEPARAAPASTAPAHAPAGGHGLGALRLGFGGRHGGGMLKVVRTVVLDSLAKRLDVTPERLRTAAHAVAVGQFEKAARTAGLTTAETDGLKACHAARVTARRSTRAAARGHARKAARRSARRTRAAACDRATLRPAMKKLKDLPEPDLAALKTEVSDALAAKLGGNLTGTKVVEAFRAELDQRLGQLVGFGVLTPTGRTKALACFDSPASCDEAGLRQELRGPLAAMAAHAEHRGARAHHRR